MSNTQSKSCPETGTSPQGFIPKRFSGINYDQRPVSYWDDSSVLQATLRNVKGENRRRLIRDFHGAGRLDQVEPGLAKDILADDDRRSLGRIHPTFLGGEYLPDYRAEETEIARIVLDSTTRDVISLRARRTKTGLLRYSVVDEYGSVFRFPKLPARGILTLGQLVDWIDQTHVDDASDADPGLGLFYTVGNHHEGEPAEDLENFTTVESDLYPGLSEHYARLSSDWVTQKFLESKEGEARSQILQSLIEEGKAANLAEADSILKEHGF